MVTLNPDWDKVLNPLPSTSTAFGGKWGVLISSLFNGEDIQLVDPNKIPVIGTSFYYKSNKLRILDTEGSHYVSVKLDNINDGNEKTLGIRGFTVGNTDYLVTENEPAQIINKTINAAANAISNLANGSIANDAGITWGKIDTTGSKLQDMKNVNTIPLLDGQALKYDASQDTWVPFTPPTNSSTTGIVGGTAVRSGNGSTTVFTIPHGMSTTPTTISVEPASAAANANPFTRTVDATNITITYTVAPVSGTNNLSYFWMASNAGGNVGNMVYTGQANTFGAFDQTIPSGNLKLSNSGFTGSFQNSLTANRTYTLPDVTGNVTLDSNTSTLTNKTINVDANTIKHSTTNTTGRLLKSNGTKFDGFDIGTAGRSLVVNAAGTDLEWADRQKPITISNLGIRGESVIKQIANNQIEAYKIDNKSARISIGTDVDDDVIEIDVVEAALSLSAIGGTLSYSKLALGGNIVDTDISAHTSSKITITNKTQLNDQIVYKDQPNTWGEHDQIFNDNKFIISNPSGNFGYRFIGGAITTEKTITLPVLTAANDVPVFETQEQTLVNKTLTAPKIATIINGTGTITLPINISTTLIGAATTDTFSNKTISLTSNTVTASSMAQGDIIAHDGTKFNRKGIGTFMQTLGVNITGTDLEYFTSPFRSIWDGYHWGATISSGGTTDEGLLHGSTQSSITSSDGKDTNGHYKQLSTGTTSGTVAGKKKDLTYTSLAEYAYLSVRWSVSNSASTATRCYIGFDTDTSTNGSLGSNTLMTASQSGIGVGYRTTDANWQIIRSDGTTPVYENTGLQKDSSAHALQKLEIRANPSAAGGAQWIVKFADQIYYYTTSIPAANTNLTYRAQIINVGSADHNIRLRGTTTATKFSW